MIQGCIPWQPKCRGEVDTTAPTLAPLIGLRLTPDQIQTVGDAVIVLTQALGGLGGTAMTLVGRARASAPLVRRQVTLQL
jgi:hypothetical protein